MDLKLLDQGKQIKPVHVYEWPGPCKFIPQHAGIASDEKGVIEVGSGGDVPGVAGQGACTEIVRAVDRMGDDYFDYLQGNPGGRGRGVS